MAWRIFRKDLILLWPLVALSVLAQLGLNALMYGADRAPEPQYLLVAARLSVIVVGLAIALAIALAVHQEPIPGTRQDWLVRPIRRADLLFAKLLFVLAAVQLPMLLGDVAEALAHGFDAAAAVTAALSRNLLVFVTLSLPAFGFAAMTRTTAQFVAAGLAYVLSTIAATILLNVISRAGGQEQATNPLIWTGVGWMARTLGRLVLAAGAMTAVLLLYLGRKIVWAWWIFPVFAGLSALTTLMPWPWIFAIQTAAAAAPAASQVLTVAIDPHAPRYSPPPGESPDDYAVGAAQVRLRGRAAGDIDVETKTRRAQGDVTVFIPIRIDGLAPGVAPWVDRASVVLRTPGGRLVYRGRGDALKLQRSHVYEAIRLPALAFEAAKAGPLTLQVDFSVSLLRPGATATAPPLGHEALLAGIGRCATVRDSDGDAVELRCLQTGPAPSCVLATLEDPATGRRNPEVRLCAPDYAPFSARLFPDALSRFEIEAPFRDRLGLAGYPVGGATLASARMRVTRYDAAGHFTRRVLASGVRPADWTAGPAGPGSTPASAEP